ncbi:hypothetical protein [Massilia scottii]|uniref:hypothetical protein n=1 Tax=Massilia scottii TaxID=3057166 RepID=UPI002796D4BB|nr:hypothetical protein [Massilia sp. CCM 9029]MDQ1831459.1 hypothetical protein [Massilia sp. CCM 9029]
MQVIDNIAILNAIGGGELSCSVSTKEVGCTGSPADFRNAISSGFNQLQSWGGSFGRWLYDMVHE